MTPSSPRCNACGKALCGSGPSAFCPSCLWAGLFEVPLPAVDEAKPGVLFSVDDLDVVEEIGRGGSGSVYRAWQNEPRREVALKMIHPQEVGSDERLARFRFEATVVSSLNHPAILPVYGAGEYRGLPYFTMKLARGGTLVERRGRYRGQWSAIAELLVGVAEAIQHAHTHGVIHRDLKPANLLFDEHNQVYVSDFGLARHVHADRRVTLVEAAFGTPAYLAPEVVAQGTGAATTSTDVYGLGAVLYELLCGRPPFAAETLAVLSRQIAEELPVSPGALMPAVPKDLEAIALRCLAKQPDQRLGSAQEVADDLRRWLTGRPVHARPISPLERLAHWCRRNPALAGVSLLFAASMVFAGLILWRQNATLRQSVVRAVSAEGEARAQLRTALINEARSHRVSSQAGRRARALALLDQARGEGADVSLRSEYIATLSRPDISVVLRVPTPRSASDDTVDLSPDFSRMLDTDGQGGFVERRAAGGQVVARFGERPHVWYLSYEGGGRLIKAQYHDGTVELWTAEQARKVWSKQGIYGPSAQPLPVAVANAGTSWAYVGGDGGLRRSSLGGGEDAFVASLGADVLWLAFNSADSLLAVVKANRVEVRAWPAGETVWAIDGHFSPTRPAWSPDGARLAVGSLEREEILVLDTASGGEARRFSAHGNDVRLLEFHPEGRFLASVAWDGLLVVQDVLTGEELLRTEAWVRTLRFSSDGGAIAYSINHAQVGLGAFAPVDCLEEWGSEDAIQGIGCQMAVSPDGRWLASADFWNVRLWDTVRRRVVAQAKAPVLSDPANELPWANLEFAADSCSLIESRRFHSVVSRPVEAARFSVPQVLSADPEAGDWLGEATPSGDRWFAHAKRGRITRWPGGNPERKELVWESAEMDGATLNPSATLLAVRLHPREGVQVIDAKSGAAVAQLASGRTLVAVFSPDGRFLITGNEQDYRVWEVANWSMTASFPAKTEGGSYGGVRFSPEGRYVVILQGRRTLQLRTVEGWKTVLDLEMPEGVWVNDYQWAPDGAGLFVLGLGHRVWRWNMVAIQRELEGRGLAW